MLPMRCPTCGTLIGDIQLIHEKEIEKIDNNEKLNEDQKNEKKKELINKYGLDKYCCRTRIITYVDIIDIII
jgi:DNA-directed RNA polymerase subunit N (RpoN/RPB10)